MQITKLDLPRCKVGEGPVWDVAEQAQYYIDIVERKVFRWDPANGDHKSWDVPDMIGSMALRGGGPKPTGAIVGMVIGINTLDFETGEVAPFALLDPPDPELQLADGKVDRRGRFVFGTSHRAMKEPRGGLWSLGVDGKLTQLDDDIHLGNGPCWSPDGALPCRQPAPLDLRLRLRHRDRHRRQPASVLRQLCLGPDPGRRDGGQRRQSVDRDLRGRGSAVPVAARGGPAGNPISDQDSGQLHVHGAAARQAVRADDRSRLHGPPVG